MDNLTQNILKKSTYIHCVGIGGSGLSGLARLLNQQGKKISGSDEKKSSATLALTNENIHIHLGHSTKNIDPKIELIIYSSAIPEHNPERLEAKKRNILQISYPQAVGMLTREKKTIAVCGTHGKTTTTAMIASAFIATDTDPTVIVGASIKELKNSNERLGQGPYFILEACEYRRAFLNFQPHIILITNIEADHLDYYKNLDDYKNAFAEFIEKLSPGGLLIANSDDKNIRSICKNYKKTKTIWFGKNEKADYQLQGKSIFHQGKKIIDLELQIPGEHNLMNACSAIAVASELKLDLNKTKEALGNYTGAARRFEYKGDIGKTIIIDDYGHHPTEIKATLKAAREKFGPDKKILCIFQPHQYSRTAKLLKEFAQSFSDVNEVIIPNILRVRDSEEEVASVNEEILVKEIAKHNPRVSFGQGFEKTAEYIKSRLENYDVIITMGAGDVWKIAEILTKVNKKI